MSCIRRFAAGGIRRYRTKPLRGQMSDHLGEAAGDALLAPELGAAEALGEL
jgi:hypothetical protein